MIKDYYRLLALPRSATLAEIKQAYRKLAAQYHPDHVAGQGPEALQQATRKMMELNAACKILCDPERKAEYDQELEWIPELPLPAAARPAAENLRPATPSPTPQATLPPEPRHAAKPAPEPASPPPRPEARLDPEYGARLKSAVMRLPLKWSEQKIRGWEWALEVSELRRAILVLYRAMDSLSLLSARAVQAGLDALQEQRKSSLRKTTLLAVLHIGRMMDVPAVREQLQALAVSKAALLGGVETLIAVREGTARAVVFGHPGEDARVAELLRILPSVS